MGLSREVSTLCEMHGHIALLFIYSQVAGACNLCGVLLIIVDTVKGKQSELHSRCCSRHSKAEHVTSNYEVKHNAANNSSII